PPVFSPLPGSPGRLPLTGPSARGKSPRNTAPDRPGVSPPGWLMDGSFGNLNLKLYTDPPSAETAALPDAAPPLPATAPDPPPDPSDPACRELPRPPPRAARGREPFSAAWFDQLEQKRYARHGAWLPAALEFGRHPGESVLLLNPGLGGDAIRYQQHGSEV